MAPKYMLLINAIFKKIGITLALTMLSQSVFAANGVISGYFRGNEMSIADISGNCGGPGDTFFYVVLDGITASSTASYNFSDTGHHYGLATSVGIYTSFNPANPVANQVGVSTFNNSISLQAGVNYTVVMQACGAENNIPGSFSYAWSGQGTLTGPWSYATPSFMSGNFDGSEPTAEIFCGDTFYHASAPTQVAVSGSYSFSDSSLHYALDISVAVYKNSFNAALPQTNLVRGMDDGDILQLEAGVNYIFVVQPLCENNTGAYEYVLLGPSAQYRITEGVNGAWANFLTLGQGIFMEYYPDIDVLFAALFTWDTTQPGSGETAVVGNPNHRWVTAQGGTAGDTANLAVTLTAGGIFDDPTVTVNTNEGTMTIIFTNCNTAVVTYNFIKAGVSGQFTINKIANDNVITCQIINNQLQVPIGS